MQHLESIVVDNTEILPMENLNPSEIETILPEVAEEGDLQVHEESLDALDKKGLHKRLVDLANMEIAQVSIKQIKALKSAFDHLVADEKERALKQYIIDGGEEEGFEFKKDADQINFEKLFFKLKENFDAHIRQLNKDKETNLKAKQEILEKIRVLVEGEDNSQSFQQLKELQKEWKNIGLVAQEHVSTLWANYNALVERFYDKRSIYFELKQLDRKKNAELKTELIEKAEKLVDEKSLSKALKELNDIHQEYKQLGPVPDEIKDVLWDRLKAVTQAVYQKRKDYLQQEAENQLQNLNAKKEIITELETLITSPMETTEAWKLGTKKVQELEEKWKQVRQVPKDEAKELNKKFWNTVKKFFHDKNVFYKSFEQELEEKLAGKKVLVERAESLQSSTEWDKTTLEIIRLQKEWKNLPNIPSKKDRQYYEAFKKACDQFFLKKREALQVLENEFKANAVAKEELIAQLEAWHIQKTAIEKENLEAIVEKWEMAGEVPHEEKGKLSNKFIKAYEDVVSVQEAWDLNVKASVKLDFRLKMAKNSPDLLKKLKDKEFGIKKRIKGLEDELDTLNNNLQFFARAKNFATLKEEYDQKMDVIRKEIDELKAEAKVYRNIKQ